jgi:hypothetical protein
MMQFTKAGTAGLAFKGLAALRKQFDEQHCVRLPNLLAPDLLDLVRRRIDQADFVERVHEGIGSNKELCLAKGTAPGLLHFFVNSDALFRQIQEITGCPRIGNFSGRVYRFSPGAGHHDAWHSDMSDHRMIAMSINLSTRPYSGGVLQIRDAASKQILYEGTNTGFGDAIVFRLAEYLQHRVSEVEGTHPKTAFAGWFRSEPDYPSVLRGGSRWTLGSGDLL